MDLGNSEPTICISRENGFRSFPCMSLNWTLLQACSYPCRCSRSRCIGARPTIPPQPPMRASARTTHPSRPPVVLALGLPSYHAGSPHRVQAHPLSAGPAPSLLPNCPTHSLLYLHLVPYVLQLSCLDSPALLIATASHFAFKPSCLKSSPHILLISSPPINASSLSEQVSTPSGTESLGPALLHLRLTLQHRTCPPPEPHSVSLQDTALPWFASRCPSLQGYTF